LGYIYGNHMATDVKTLKCAAERMSPQGPDCVKTRASQERAELFSQ
jgi:hypothetical protein